MLAQQEAVDFLKQEIEVLQVAVVQGENVAAEVGMVQLIIGSVQL
jgi:hypothetical protein